MLVRAASAHKLIRDLSTTHDAQVAVGARQVQFRNTNRLVSDPSWDIVLQKTGYISAAGRCLVMQAQLAGRKLTMVLLDSAGKYSRLGDAERIRQWLTNSDGSTSIVSSAVRYAGADLPRRAGVRALGASNGCGRCAVAEGYAICRLPWPSHVRARTPPVDLRAQTLTGRPPTGPGRRTHLRPCSALRVRVLRRRARRLARAPRSMHARVLPGP